MAQRPSSVCNDGIQAVWARWLLSSCHHSQMPTLAATAPVATNNFAANLEWVDRRGNMTHAIGRPVIQKNGAGEGIARYDSITLAAESAGVTIQSIRSAIARMGKSAGSHWEYAADDAEGGVDDAADDAEGAA